eukprot:TRINITY_DN5105_c0_g1_i1.p1 TRINITY_DN5105_c0_g1~~TRINITY_DN5105_c0_g1_i1.p1  ORF type:complete len:348 (-),score=68.91 TRINITY_DN5105_c0_g1_i1:118-1161(-)
MRLGAVLLPQHMAMLLPDNLHFSADEWVAIESENGLKRYGMVVGLESGSEMNASYHVQLDGESLRVFYASVIHKFSANLNVEDAGLAAHQVVADIEERKECDIQDSFDNSSSRELQTLEKNFNTSMKESRKFQNCRKNERKNAFRRLYLRWHTDENLEVCELITGLRDQLSRGDSNLDTNESRQDQERKQKLRDAEVASWGCQSRNEQRYNEQQLKRKVDPAEAKTWLSQVKYDLDPPKPHLRVFAAQQAIEKCLKSLIYATVGMDKTCLMTHSLSDLLEKCSRSDRESLEDFVTSFGDESVYTKARYPNCWSKGLIPADMFSAEYADRCEIAMRGVIRHVESIVRL